MASSRNGALESDVTYEDLYLLEHEFHQVDSEILRKQWHLSKPLYEKRNALASRIPNFWALVLEEAPQEVDSYIQPSDSEVFAECLKNISVERFDIDREPRSFSLRFEFGANKWFEDAVLEKRFWHRRSRGSWQGLISEPIKIKWKKGKDLTGGITDDSVALWQAFQNSGDKSSSGFAKLKGSKDWKTLAKKLETIDLSSISFFAFFAFISTFRYVDEKESEQALQAETERREKRASGERIDDPEDDEELVEEEEIMVCPHGEDLALTIADDLYPNAIKYFTTSNEREDENEDDSAMEEDDMESDDSEDEAELNIRKLVAGSSHKKRRQETSTSASPPPSSRARREA